MPDARSAPGGYVEEIPSDMRTITGVATSITAFVGAARRGPVEKPVRVQSFAEFERAFGGLWRQSPMTYAVSHFFQNGGSDALIVRVATRTAAAATGAADNPATLSLVAASVGEWGGRLRVQVDHDTRPEVGSEQLFNLTVLDPESGATERFLDVSVLPGHPRFITRVLENESDLVRVAGTVPPARPAATPAVANDPLPPGSLGFNADGGDGGPIGDANVAAASLEGDRRGLWALEHADIFNLLCIPPFTFTGDVGARTRSAAAEYARRRRAFYIVDPLVAWDAPAALLSGPNSLDGATWGLAGTDSAAVYFPRVRMPDPLQEGRLADFPPCGAVAGIFARTDRERGVWKAPAGRDATLNGVAELSVKLTERGSDQLNQAGVNGLRAFSGIGRVVWGARTFRGADAPPSELKYIPVRRLALFIEESLSRGTKWVAFEPNDEPLWAQIRLNVGAFMQNLFRQGALQGRSPHQAYFVRCGRETTTQDDINRGIVNIVVGFAPARPAEFLIITLQQMAGQVAV